MKHSVKRRIRFSDEVQRILYKMGGCTTAQVSHWLALLVEEVEQRDYRSLARRAMTQPEHRSQRPPLPPSYRIATAVLFAMREAGEVEEIRIRRSHEGRPELGRLESFYRLSTAKNREAALEAGFTSGVDAEDARSGYARVWSGGAIQHTAHRTDLLAVLSEAGRTAEHNECDVLVEPGSEWGESHPGYPLVGARIEKTDAAGKRRYTGKQQKKSGYTGRLYESVVPDGEIVLHILPLSEPLSENSSRHAPYSPPDQSRLPEETWRNEPEGTSGLEYA